MTFQKDYQLKYLQEKLTPMTWHDIESNEAASDIEQYTK